MLLRRAGWPVTANIAARAASMTGAAARRRGAPSRTASTAKLTVTDLANDCTTDYDVPLGENLMEFALEADIELECACEGQLSCSTCHVVVLSDHFETLPEPEEEELDMLDLAMGLTERSRLGCQVVMTPELDGLHVRIPDPMDPDRES